MIGAVFMMALMALVVSFVVSCDETTSSDSTSMTRVGYQNEAWLSLRAQACSGDDEDLSINNGSERTDLSSDNLSCTRTNTDNQFVYSIQWTGSDFDKDGSNDTLSFDVRVEGFDGSTYSYSEIEGGSSVTELGASSAVTDSTDVSDLGEDGLSVWGVNDSDDIDGVAAGQSLRFSVENIVVSANDYSATFNGFNLIETVETNGGREHTHIRGEGSDLDSGTFSTTTSKFSFDASDEFVITGSGDYYRSRVWGITDIQFSFSITYPSLTTQWGVSDYSIYGIGPLYSGVYPEEERDRQDDFPVFSWDTVPRWLAIRNADVYSDDQIETIANNYQLVLLEKANKAGFDTVDEGIKDTAKRLKVINSKIKNIFYWNSYIHYTGYSHDDEYAENAESWSNLDNDGEIYLHKDKYYTYNPSVEDMRTWWVDFPAKIATDANIDGVFVDNMRSADEDQLFVDGKPSTDYLTMINALWESMPDDKLLMGNALRNEFNNGNRAVMEILDGSYLERWSMSCDDDLPVQTTADAMSVSIQLMREALAQGKFVAFQTTAWSDEDIPDDYDDKLVYMGENVDFPLAIFLIVAQENAYFSYQLGVNVKDSAENVWDSSYIDVLSHRLGEPLGDPVKDGYVYTRSFEYVDVWLDLEAEKAILTWRDEPLSAD
jgi:hypothetical protein